MIIMSDPARRFAPIFDILGRLMVSTYPIVVASVITWGTYTTKSNVQHDKQIGELEKSVVQLESKMRDADALVELSVISKIDAKNQTKYVEIATKLESIKMAVARMEGQALLFRELDKQRTATAH